MLNRHIAAVAVALLVTGCATPRPRMAIEDLRRYQIDCANKEAQVRFLESQKTTQNDRLAAAFSGSLIDELKAKHGGYTTERTAIATQEYDSMASHHIWNLRSHCPTSDYERRLNADPNITYLESDNDIKYIKYR